MPVARARKTARRPACHYRRKYLRKVINRGLKIHMSESSGAAPLKSSPVVRLAGEITVPGDKSMSHRALILGGLAIGETTVSGLLEGDDVLHTADAMRAFGARIERGGDGIWRIRGCGVGGLREPDNVIDMGNSGTAVRLLMGLAASMDFPAFFVGDASLSARPMGRVLTPLSRMGARFITHSGGRLPLAVIGTEAPQPIEYRLPVASAQVKSAILLAALNTPGTTTVIEDRPTRDHTENMLRLFGLDEMALQVWEEEGLRHIALSGPVELQGTRVEVPGDPSSAAFAIVAALLAPEGEVLVRNVALNPLRTGLLQTLTEMGADIERCNRRQAGGEEIADLRIRPSILHGVDVPPERAPSMIDEYPVLAIAAAAAQGCTRVSGAGELRVKESDRIAAMARGLEACGVAMEECEDGFVIEGCGAAAAIPGGGSVITHMDHRIAMSFLVLGMVADAPVSIDSGAMIATSYPGFVADMNRLGARIAAAGDTA